MEKDMEEKVIVDTDIIIDYAYGHLHPLQDFLEKLDKKELTLITSSLTVFEYYSGFSLDDAKQLELTDLLFSKFLIQEVTLQIARLAAQMNRTHRLHTKMATIDILIAATTLTLDASLLTRNKKHYRHIASLKFAKI